jgi:hypothetical protein
VQPDDDPMRPVLIKRHGRKFSFEHGEGELYEVRGYTDAARANVLRAEMVRARGIFPVVDHVTGDAGWGGGTRYVYLKWHSDRGCPCAAGKDAYDPADRPQGVICGYEAEGRGVRYPGARWSVLDVADALTRAGQAPGELCAECITGLDPEAPAVRESAGAVA